MQTDFSSGIPESKCINNCINKLKSWAFKKPFSMINIKIVLTYGLINGYRYSVNAGQSQEKLKILRYFSEMKTTQNVKAIIAAFFRTHFLTFCFKVLTANTCII